MVGVGDKSDVALVSQWRARRTGLRLARAYLAYALKPGAVVHRYNRPLPCHPSNSTTRSSFMSGLAIRVVHKSMRLLQTQLSRLPVFQLNHCEIWMIKRHG